MSALVDKVAQKLGISREAATDRVDAFVDRIQSLTGEGSTMQVEGLGTFTVEEDRVRFTADSRLAAVVNHRFAGLAPLPVESVADAGHIDEASFALPDIPIAVPLDMDVGSDREHEASTSGRSSGDVEDIADEIRDHHVDPGSVSAVGPGDLENGAIDVPPTDVATPMDSEIPEGGDDEGIAEDIGAHEPTTITRMGAEDTGDLGEIEAEVADAIDTGDSDAVDATVSNAIEAGEAAAHDAEVVESEDVTGPADIVSDAVGIDDSGTVPDHEMNTGDVATVPDEEAAGAAPDSGQPPPAIVKRKSRALFYFGMIVVLLLGIAGVLYLISLGDGPPSDRQDEMVESEAGTSPGGSEAAATQPPGTRPPLITWEPGAIDRRAGGYTLIVSSQETIDEANAVALELSHQLADEGLPIDVLTGTARGQTWYRVAIGQYSRQSIATRELRRLAEKLPEGAWVLRIRNNM